MNIQDQWFSPGDKVMEVDVEAAMEKAVPGYRDIKNYADTKPGLVYCVERFEEETDWWNGVWLVGVDCGPDGLYAAEFRRVEEIRICANAVRKIEQPVKVPSTMP